MTKSQSSKELIRSSVTFELLKELVEDVISSAVDYGASTGDQETFQAFYQLDSSSEKLYTVLEALAEKQS